MLAALANIQEKLSKLTILHPINDSSVDIRISTNIGYLIYPDDCGRQKDFSSITRYAALTSLGFETYQFNSQMRRFNYRLASEADRANIIEERLSLALLSRDIDMNYQPKFNVKTGELIGAEALVRWNDQDLGFVSAIEFLAIIENSEKIILFTQVTLEKTIEFIKKIEKELPVGFHISVNISQNLFNWEQANIVEITSNLLKHYDCPGSLLEFEITESAYFSKEICNAVHSLLTL